jgi:hypothetical protein
MNVTKSLFAAVLSAALIAWMASPSQAVVTINFNPGTTQVTTGLTGFVTFGDNMDGMAVTAFFVGGGSQTASWADTGSGAGAATGTGWSLGEVGDTFDGTGLWTLTNVSASGIDRVFIDAGLGDAVFDSITDPSLTAGSARGWPFELDSFTGSGDIDVTYKDQVALTGDAPLGDLWRLMTIDFLDAAGLAPGQALGYHQDTDSFEIQGDIGPVVLVPEPATIALSVLGLIGWGVSALRRRA